MTDILDKSFSIIFYSINAYFNFCTFYTFGGKLRWETEIHAVDRCKIMGHSGSLHMEQSKLKKKGGGW